ncbi:hypothetical protein BOTBODRAFT_152287 [Botryobasidium botryosum FD-172 SS1]|uniref:tRNA(Ile)-lysidine synthetase n=1 Tax=Botryobasidium botryosum (strain FD-172 SS1) TaxID=930990 RepID=A0A067N7P9_BOTB1|nr:hypothetical protein BOTBODRAFT_152287 [Botryobasidium botryosum FD-172 SS1]
MVASRPITNLEFARMMRKARPPMGWGQRVAIALSGGADSLCLLFLLQRLIHNPQSVSTLSQWTSLLSLTIDHQLQPSSAETATKTAMVSRALGVPNLVHPIVWSTPPFPPRPPPGAPFEAVARASRYRLIFDIMEKEGINTIVMGHHLDDQIETALMRMGRGSSGAGMAGMRSVRRWGMGDGEEGGLEWFGSAGMARWIARPFLSIGKDRILCTCEAHDLPFIEDKTNFQPEITFRNAVRSVISGGVSAPFFLIEVSETISKSIARMTSSGKTLIPGSEDLGQHELLQKYALLTDYLNAHTYPSPPSTFLLLTSPSAAPPPPDLRAAIVFRIMRYVSPHPWGSPRAEAGRRAASAELISKRLWGSRSAEKPFSAGSEVLWTPVAIRRDGRMRFGGGPARDEERAGWLASRAPPMRRHRSAGGREGAGLERDLTTQVLLGGADLEVLFDCRFFICVRSHSLPDHVKDALANGATMHVVPDGRWLLPKVVLRGMVGAEERDMILGGVDVGHPEAMSNTSWLKVSYIRSLDAI